MGSSKNFFNRFTFDDDIIRCRGGCKDSLDIFELWLRFLGEDVRFSDITLMDIDSHMDN